MLLTREKARDTNDITIMDSYFTVWSHQSGPTEAGKNHEPTLSKLTGSAL